MDDLEQRTHGRVPPRSALSGDARAALLDLVTDLAFVLEVDSDGTLSLEWVSSGFRDLTGMSRTETEARGWASVIHADDLPKVARAFDRAAHGEAFQIEFRVTDNDGGVRWLAARSHPIADLEDGRVVRICGTATDITRRRQLEDRWRHVSELTSDVAFSLRVTDGTLIPDWVAGSYEELTGFTISEMGVLDSWRSLVPEEQHQRFDEIVRRVLGGQDDECDLCIIRKDGSSRWLRVQARGVRGIDGNVVQVLGAVRDITDDRRQADALAESEARYRALVEHSPDGIVIVQDDQFVYANPAAAAILGAADSEALVGRTVFDFVSPEAREEILAERDANGGHAEITLTRLDGVRIRLDAQATIVIHEGHPATQVVTRDITDRHRARVALERALRQERRATEHLREADRLKELFLETVSHELRTPLTPIIGFATALRSHPNEYSVEDRVEMVEGILKNAQHMADLVDHLLEFAAVDAPNGDPPEARDLAVVLGSILSSLQEVTARHELVTDFTADLLVAVDPLQLQRVVSSLVANAVKYSEPSSTVTVGCEHHATGAVVWVADEGIGIPEDLDASLFERFSQGPQQPLGRQGLGMGLALAQRAAERMGGTLWYESTVGEGTRFSFTVPIMKNEIG